jgi:hypothetical protein
MLGSHGVEKTKFPGANKKHHTERVTRYGTKVTEEVAPTPGMSLLLFLSTQSLKLITDRRRKGPQLAETSRSNRTLSKALQQAVNVMGQRSMLELGADYDEYFEP